MIRAGELRHRIIIQQPTLEQDEYGAEIPDWAQWRRAWAKIEPLSGREFEYGRSFAATVTHKMTIRYTADLLTTYRILFRERLFQINGAIDPEERKREMVLFCTEMVGVTDDA